MINFIVCSCIIDGSCTKSADYISNSNSNNSNENKNNNDDDDDYNDKDFMEGLINSSLYQINIPDGLESRTYGALYRLLAKRKQIPLGTIIIIITTIIHYSDHHHHHHHELS